MSLFSCAEISDATWFVMQCHLSRSDHFEDYRNIHKIPQKIMLMNVGNPEALETLNRNPLSCFPPIWRPHVIDFWETQLLPPKGGQNQHRSSWKFWCRMLRRDLLPCRDLFLQLQKEAIFIFWVVVSNIFYFHPYLGKWSILTNIFEMGWNHQPVFPLFWTKPAGDVSTQVVRWEPKISISLGTPSSMWKAKEKVETVLGSTLEQCCEPIYCDLAYVSKRLWVRHVYQYVMYVWHVFLADDFWISGIRSILPRFRDSMGFPPKNWTASCCQRWHVQDLLWSYV